MRFALILAALGSAAFAQPTGPNAIELLRRSIQPEKVNAEKARQYAYREYQITQERDKNGKETDRKTETWDVIGLEGFTYRKLILRNDQPLPLKEQKREDERLAKETAQRKKETPEQRRKRLFSLSYSIQSIPPERMLELYDLQFQGTEDVEGRAAYVIEGMPKPGAHAADDNEKEHLNYRTKMWIDSEDYVVARGEMEVIGEHSRMQKGSLIEATSFRNELGVWLPKKVRFRFDVRFLKMVNVRGDMTSEFSDYRRFQVDSQLVEAKP